MNGPRHISSVFVFLRDRISLYGLLGVIVLAWGLFIPLEIPRRPAAGVTVWDNSRGVRHTARELLTGFIRLNNMSHYNTWWADDGGARVAYIKTILEPGRLPTMAEIYVAWPMLIIDS